MSIRQTGKLGQRLTPVVAGAVLLITAGLAAAQGGPGVTSQTITSTGGVSTTGGGLPPSSGNFGGTFGSGNFGGSFGSGGSVSGATSMTNPFTGTNGSSNGVNFLGQSAVTAGGMAGRPGVGSGTTTGPTSGNPFQAYYGNPLAMGVLNATDSSFGSPIYNMTGFSTTGGLTGTGLGGTAALRTGLTGSAGGLNALSGIGGSSIGVRRALPYFTTLGFARRPALAPLQVRTDLRLTLARSTVLRSRDNIDVLMDGTTVVLRGQVADERERRLAENMLRLSPGVRDIRNELEVLVAPAPTP
jgi:hypothetical protein